MKQENRKKSKLWLWLLLALVVVAAVAVAAVVLLQPQQGGQEQTPVDQTPKSEIYWNIDGAHFMEISDVPGTSAREPGEDGLYHILFLVNGQQKELLVADKRLVNYIDSLQMMGLVFDENGNVIDALDIKTVAEEIAKEFFVKKLENGILEINSSRAMNGMPLQVTVDDNTIISDMTATGDAQGQPGTPEPLDKVHVYKSLDGTKTFVYIVERAPEQKSVYWRVERCWDATAGKSTRVPDKNGVYTMEFACNGEVVELKCRDSALVGTIDASAVLTGQFCFDFDEEGYIVKTVDVGSATRTTYIAGDFHITDIQGETITATKLSSGSNQGKVVTFKMAEEYDIFHCCQYACYDGDCGQRTELKVGDRVNVYADLDGNGKLIFVTRRLCGSPMYYNFNRQYGGNMEVGTLRKKTGGYYVFEMLCEGKIVKVKVKDKKLADQMEAIYNRCMGLEVDEKGVVQRMYDATCVYGGSNLGTESFVTELTGPVITIASSASDTTWNSILSGDCKVYNVIQGEYGAKIGGETDLRIGDQITAFRNNAEQMQIIFVMSRPVDGGKVYYNLQRKYNTAEKTTTREPNEEGYYEFLFACEGKQVTAKTKSKGMASFIDEQLAPLVGLKVNKNGIITNAYSVAAVLKQSAKSCNYRYVEKVTKKTFNTFYYPAATPDKKTVDTTTWNIAKDCVVYNVSTAVSEFRGEKSTLKNGDYIQAIRNLKTNEITQIWIMTRNPAYGVKSYKAHCDHCDKEVTWEPYIGKVTSGEKHYFLFDNISYAQAIVGTKDTEDATYDVVLDLKGKTLNGDGRCFLVYDHLTIMDSKGGGKIMGTNPHSSGSAHSGGCIMVAGGKLDILGGTLGQNESSTEFGTMAGVIYVGGAGVEVNMYGGTLLGGTTTVNGGCVGIYGGTFNMYGGEIKGGTSPLGANIYVSSGNLNLLGGSVDGGIEMSGSAKLQLEGKLTITGNGIKIPAGKKLDLSKLDTQSRIAVQATGVFTEAYDNIADYEVVFTPGVAEDKIILRDNALRYISSGPSDFVLDTDNDGMAVCPVCNVDVAWTPVTGRLGSSMSGHYYLNANIDDPNSQWATTTAKDAVLCIHMNGYNLTTSGRIATVGSGGTINIMGDGTITGQGDYSGTDAETYTKATLIASTGPINLYGNVKVTTTAEDKPIVSNRIRFTLNDNATIEGNENNLAISQERGETLLAGGKIIGGVLAETGTLTLDGAVDVDLMGITAAAKLKVEGGFTGNANALFANPLVEGAVPEANGISTGEFTGKLYSLDLETAEPTQLFGKSGRLCTEDAQVTPPEPDFVLDPDGDNKAVCPVCGGAEVEWTPVAGTASVGSAKSGHYYLLEDGVHTGMQYATTTAKDAVICLHMNGKNLTTGGRIATVGNGGTINIMGKGTITGAGTYNGGTDAFTLATLVANSAGAINVYDDVTVTTTATGKAVATALTNASLNLYGNAKLVAMEGGIGINAEKGKVTLNDAACVDNMTIAAISKLTVNGNWTGTAKVTFAAALVEGVVPEANGASTGNFSGSLTMGDETLIGKDGKLMTGVYVPEPVFVLDPNGDNKAVCPVCGGEEVTWTPIEAGKRVGTSASGHYYLLDDSVNTDSQYATTTAKEHTICLHLNGKDLTTAGRIAMVGNGGTINIMGKGNITSNASSAYSEATLVAGSSGTMSLYDDVTVTIAADGKPVVELRGSTTLNLNDNAKIVAKAGGVGITVKGKLFMNDAATVSNMTVETNGKVTVNGNWTGTAEVTFAAALVNGVVPEANGASTGAFAGSLTMNGKKLVGKEGKLALDEVEAPQEELVLDGSNQAQCPVCEKLVTWTPVTASLGDTVVDGGHYYLTGDYNNPNQFMTVTQGKTVCFHNNGYTLTYPSRIFVTGATLNMMGGGKVIGKTTTADPNLGAVVAAWADGYVNLYGGTYSTDTDAPALKLHGDAKVRVNVYDGVVIESAQIHKGTLTLHGNCQIGSLKVETTGKLVIDSSFTGDVKVAFDAALVDGVVPEANGASNGSFTGSLTMGEQKLMGQDGKLMVQNINSNVAKGNAVAAAAAATDFTNYQTGTAVRCPVCEKDVTWEPINGMGKAVVDGGHYYVNKDITGDGIFLTVNGKKVCVHLNGKTLTYGARIFATSASTANPGTLNLMGKGTVASSNTHADYGTGTVHAASAGIINLYGGTYKSTGANTKAVVHTTGGTVNIYSGATVDSNTGTNVLLEKGTVNLYGGTIKNGTGFLSGSNRLGGNVYLKSSGSAFHVIDGTISGGTATYGGNIRGEADTTITMDGGQITGGNATGGAGNVNTNGTFTMNGGTVSGGTTTGQGGNIWSKGTVTIGKDATVSGGSAKEGGNIAITGDSAEKIGTLNTCGTISGGTTTGSAAHGGNISGTSNTVINITGGKIYGGSAAGQGGNVRMYNGQLNISGGEIYGGSAAGASNHNVWTAGTAVLTFTGGTVKGLDGTNAAGTAIMANGGVVYLGGNAQAIRTDGVAKGNISVSSGAKLCVLNDWIGTASVKLAASYTAGSTVADTNGQCGALAEGVFTAGGSYTGILTNENGDAVKILGVQGALVLDQLPAAE